MGYIYKEKPEWGKLLAKFGAADLGITYIYERQLVETFPRDPVEYLDISSERAEEMIVSMEKSTFYYKMNIPGSKQSKIDECDHQWDYVSGEERVCRECGKRETKY